MQTYIVDTRKDYNSQSVDVYQANKASVWVKGFNSVWSCANTIYEALAYMAVTHEALMLSEDT